MRRPLAVLGSGQSADVLLPEVVGELGCDVVRRRTGGAFVWLDADMWWADVSITRDDRLWNDDISVAFHWLGYALADALGELLDVVPANGLLDGGPGLDVHIGRLRTTPWSDIVCFAGLGPGEITSAGRKVVGLSQRRTRDGAIFQVGVLLRWNPEAWRRVVGVPAGVLDPIGVGLDQISPGSGSPSRVTAAVVRALGTATRGAGNLG